MNLTDGILNKIPNYQDILKNIVAKKTFNINGLSAIHKAHIVFNLTKHF